MSKPIQKFVDRLQSVLGPHEKAKPEALLKELHVHLGKFTEEELQEAATLLFAGQKSKYWPTFGSMVIAAEEARKKLRKIDDQRTPLGRRMIRDSLGQLIPAKTKSEEEGYWSRKAFDEADNLVNSDLGRKAADEGWIGDLYDFCRHHRRLPIPCEQHKLIRYSRQTDELFASTTRDKALNRFVAAFLDRRKHLSGVAHGKGSGYRWQVANEARLAGGAPRT